MSHTTPISSSCNIFILKHVSRNSFIHFSSPQTLQCTTPIIPSTNPISQLLRKSKQHHIVTLSVNYRNEGINLQDLRDIGMKETNSDKLDASLVPISPAVIEKWLENGLHLGENRMHLYRKGKLIQSLRCFYFEIPIERPRRSPSLGSTHGTITVSAQDTGDLIPIDDSTNEESTAALNRSALQLSPHPQARFILFDLSILSNQSKDFLLLWKNKDKTLKMFRTLLNRLKFVQGYHIIYLAKNRYSSEEELHRNLFKCANLPAGFVITSHLNWMGQMTERGTDFVSSMAKFFRYNQIEEKLHSLPWWPSRDKSPEYSISAMNSAFDLHRFTRELRLSRNQLVDFFQLCLFREYDLREIYCEYAKIDHQSKRVFAVRRKGIFASASNTEKPVFSSVEDLSSPQVLAQIVPMRPLYAQHLPFNCISLVMEFLPFESKVSASQTNEVWRSVFQTVFLSPDMKSFCKKTRLKVSTLANYIGLQQFLQENFLYKRITFYKHSLFDNENDTVVIMVNGEYVSWSHFREQYLAFENHASPENYKNKFVVNQQYLLKNATYAWKGLQIFPDYRDTVDIEALNVKSQHLEQVIANGDVIVFDKRDPAQWGSCNMICLKVDCSLSTGPRVVGDHTFLQLCSEEGYMFSFGLYAKDWSQIGNMMQTGTVLTPDPNEYFVKPNGTIISCAFKIPRRTWNAFLKENLRFIRDEKFIFHVSKSNCTDYCMRYFHELGIHLPSNYSIMNHASHGGYEFLRLFPQTENLEALFRIPSSLVVSSAATAMTRELKQRLRDPQQKAILTKTNPSLFITVNGHLDLRATSVYLYEHLFKATELSSPYVLGKLLLHIENKRAKKGDPYYVSTKYKETKYDRLFDPKRARGALEQIRSPIMTPQDDE